MLDSIFNHKEVFKVLIEDLLLSTHTYLKKEIYDKFYVQREREISQLNSRFVSMKNYGGNILLVGARRVGKTAFLRHYFDNVYDYHSDYKLKINKYFIDLRGISQSYNYEDRNTFFVNLQNKLIEVMLKVLVSFNDPCHDLDDYKNIDDKFFYCTSKLSELNLKFRDEKRTKDCERELHYLFVDDVDYLLPDDFIRFLGKLKPTLMSHAIIVVLACRYPAFNTIKSFGDPIIKHSFTDSLSIFLDPLSPQIILNPRFKFLEDYKTLGKLINGDCIFANFLIKIEKIRNYIFALEEITDLTLFSFPYTDTHLDYMRYISNGNIDQILLIANELLRYMIDNTDKIRKISRGGYWIGKRAIFNIFTPQTSGLIDDFIRIHNINAKKTRTYKKKVASKLVLDQHRSGNSIYYVLLEFFNIHQYPLRVDMQSYKKLFYEYGITLDESKIAIIDLIDMGLIRERMIKCPTSIGHLAHSKSDIFKDYDLIDRGKYYLSFLTKWYVYIEEYGVSQHNRVYRSQVVKEIIEICILSLVRNIYLIYKKKTGKDDFKVKRHLLTDFINKTYKPYFSFLSFNSGLSDLDYELDIDDMDFYLSDVSGIIEDLKLYRMDNYLFYGKRIIKTYNKYKLIISDDNYIDHNQIEGFTNMNVNVPEYADKK